MLVGVRVTEQAWVIRTGFVVIVALVIYQTGRTTQYVYTLAVPGTKIRCALQFVIAFTAIYRTTAPVALITAFKALLFTCLGRTTRIVVTNLACWATTVLGAGPAGFLAVTLAVAAHACIHTFALMAYLSQLAVPAIQGAAAAILVPVTAFLADVRAGPGCTTRVVVTHVTVAAPAVFGA